MPSQSHWYALHTRSRHEKHAARHLKEKGVVAFLPLLDVSHRWSDRNKIVEMPLFPGYFFVQVDLSVETRLLILRVPGVVGFVGARGWGSPIPDKQILDLETVLAHKVSCGLYPFLREGQRVRVRGGCLDGIEGILVECNSDRSLVLSVDSIQRSALIRITGYDVELVSPSRPVSGGWKSLRGTRNREGPTGQAGF